MLSERRDIVVIADKTLGSQYGVIAIRENMRPAARASKAHPRRHGYPPDKQEKATQTVLEQAAMLS